MLPTGQHLLEEVGTDELGQLIPDPQHRLVLGQAPLGREVQPNQQRGRALGVGDHGDEAAVQVVRVADGAASAHVVAIHHGERDTALASPGGAARKQLAPNPPIEVVVAQLGGLHDVLSPNVREPHVVEGPGNQVAQPSAGPLVQARLFEVELGRDGSEVDLVEDRQGGRDDLASDGSEELLLAQAVDDGLEVVEGELDICCGGHF